MDDTIRQALATGQVIDITTVGRQSGQPRRIEIWYHILDDQVYITGLPGRRGWYANLRAHPAFTFHLKQGVQADLPAHALPIVDPQERRHIFSRLLPRMDLAAEVENWVAGSPLVRVTFDEA
jgi:deazaflavin-dependent oxidoreductase (nitroreductase family)